jgi:hypothetical protein
MDINEGFRRENQSIAIADVPATFDSPNPNGEVGPC